MEHRQRTEPRLDFALRSRKGGGVWRLSREFEGALAMRGLYEFGQGSQQRYGALDIETSLLVSRLHRRRPRFETVDRAQDAGRVGSAHAAREFVEKPAPALGLPDRGLHNLQPGFPNP